MSEQKINNKLKGYFIPFGARKLVSINKKIDMQIRLLSSIAQMHETDVEVFLDSNIETLKSILLHGSLKTDYSKALKDIKDPDFIFIRHAGVDRQYIRFLKKIKTKYPNCRIIDEIPTYPYMKEMLKAKSNWLLLLGELRNRRYAKKYIDRYLIYSDYLAVHGVKTISTMNGIEVDNIKPVKDACDRSTIRLLTVAYMQQYHGYERIIKSISKYYSEGGTRNIILRIVGDGPETNRYKSLVQKLKIDDHVLFYGRRVGQELTDIYEVSDMGIEALGGYKTGRFISTTLKAREYSAYGLPTISACDVDLFLKHPFNYFLKLPNNSSVFNLQEIIDFYDRIFVRDRAEIAKEIHAYAREYADINKVYAPLLEYLSSEVNNEE